MAKSAVAESPVYVRWEELSGSGDKGRREVRYFLKREDGSSDLAVVGKDKSRPRHMSCRYTIRNRSLLSILPSPSHLKLTTRAEVIDWLNSIVSVSTSRRSLQPPNSHIEVTDLHRLDVESLKDIQLQKLGHYTKEFLWLGSAWTCRKKRKHYHSFCRNGVKISVHDFVFVLAEENNRLVAYLEDMYEDFKSNKMVVVRWFHKIDEVGIVLPNNFNDREIFFSLCLQDLSIECIDGLATVLSPPHFKKFLNEATNTQLEPYVCHRQFENDDVKPFDVTQVKGYWKQEILRYMYTYSPANVCVKPQSYDGDRLIENANNVFSARPKKILRHSSDCDVLLDFTDKHDEKKEYTAADGGHKKNGDNGLTYCHGGNEKRGWKDAFMSELSAKETVNQNSEYLFVGSHVEVLCQDSGIRGCWFRAMIIKKHKDKVKVRYQDIKDAVDEDNNLEEWLLASRVAVPDGLGLRKCGRNTVRPAQQCDKSSVSWAIGVGCVVDVWWHDGWWEGIVTEKKSEDQFHVYFPGEERKSIFGCRDLRHSQEWFGGNWEHVKENPDVVRLILSEDRVGSVDGRADSNPVITNKDDILVKDKAEDKPRKEADVVWDLSKDDSLSLLKWNSSTKRKRGSGSTIQKSNHSVSAYDASETEAVRSGSCERRFLLPKSLKADHDNCKYIGDTLFSSPVITHLTNLVMSR